MIVNPFSPADADFDVCDPCGGTGIIEKVQCDRCGEEWEKSFFCDQCSGIKIRYIEFHTREEWDVEEERYHEDVCLNCCNHAVAGSVRFPNPDLVPTPDDLPF